MKFYPLDIPYNFYLYLVGADGRGRVDLLFNL